jgi:hypothetical protein
MQRRKDTDASPYLNDPIALMHVLCIDGGITAPLILAAAAPSAPKLEPRSARNFDPPTVETV